MREIDKIKEFVLNNQNNLHIEAYHQGWYTKNATIAVLEEYELLIIYDGEPVPENEICRVNEYDFDVPNKDELKEMVNNYINNTSPNTYNMPDNSICKHWRIRKVGEDEWLIISHLSLEDYIKSIELVNR